MNQLLIHPTCSTCKKARAWLDENKVSYEVTDMIATPPSAKQLAEWMKQSDLPIRRFFNTSGQKYRDLGLKEKVGDMDIKEASELLATDGMLIKRPIMFNGDKLTVGFKESDYASTWK